MPETSPPVEQAAFSLFRCHACQSEDISAQPPDATDSTVFQDVTCNACGATRVEHFRFYLATTTVEPDFKERVLYEEPALPADAIKHLLHLVSVHVHGPLAKADLTERLTRML
jgi:hypothetical protein